MKYPSIETLKCILRERSESWKLKKLGRFVHKYHIDINALLTTRMSYKHFSLYTLLLVMEYQRRLGKLQFTNDEKQYINNYIISVRKEYMRDRPTFNT